MNSEMQRALSERASMRGSVAKRVVIGALGTIVLCGCAGVSPSQVGQTAGTIAGAAVAPGVGAPLGALVGLLAGMVVEGQVDRATERRERVELGEQLADDPALAADRVGAPHNQPVRVWVDETVHEGRVVAGHFDVRYVP